MTTYSTDPALYIYTSLTAGSSHIVTATSRLETILRANRVPFKAIDIATDEKAKMLWGRRAKKDESGRVRKLPGLVQEGLVLGDIVEIEEWNEYGELKQHVKIYYDEHTIPDIHHKHPIPKIRRVIKKAATATTNAGADGAGSVAGTALARTASKDGAEASSAGTPAPANPPPAPAPGTAKPIAKSSSKDEAAPKNKIEVKTESNKETAPMRSMADEAAQKAKELRLRTLREKVHGKPGPESKDDKKETVADAEKKVEADKEKPTQELKQNAERNTPGLQSPTSGKWKDDNLPDVQSPKSSMWKSAVIEKGGEVKANTAPKKQEVEDEDESNEEEDGDSDDDEEEDDEDEDDDDDEEEDDDEDSDEDDSDEEESDEDTGDEDDKKPAAPAIKK